MEDEYLDQHMEDLLSGGDDFPYEPDYETFEKNCLDEDAACGEFDQDYDDEFFSEEYDPLGEE